VLEMQYMALINPGVAAFVFLTLFSSGAGIVFLVFCLIDAALRPFGIHFLDDIFRLFRRDDGPEGRDANNGGPGPDDPGPPGHALISA
jgi:hypothetical protein